MISDSLLSRLERLCSRTECCSSDIMDKAVRILLSDAGREGLELSYGSAVEEAEKLLDSLVSGGYVDDFRYASAFAREKSGLTGWGPAKIRHALAAKRIDESTIGRAMQEIDASRACSRLEKLLATKWRSLKGDPQGTQKLVRFALGRGYDYGMVSEMVNHIISSRR